MADTASVPLVSLFTEIDDPRCSQARPYGRENILRMATWPSSAVPTMCCRSRAIQSQLHEAVAETFAVELAEGFEGCDHDCHKTVNKNHDRIETRRCWAQGTPEPPGMWTPTRPDPTCTAWS